jgi:hypothetical protein
VLDCRKKRDEKVKEGEILSNNSCEDRKEREEKLFLFC